MSKKFRKIFNSRKRNVNVVDRPLTKADIANELGREEEIVSIEPAEVVDIILNDTHEYWNADMPGP